MPFIEIARKILKFLDVCDEALGKFLVEQSLAICTFPLQAPAASMHGRGLLIVIG